MEEKSNFQYCEETKIKQVVYISQVGFYGARLLFIPSPLMAFFDGGPVPNYMTVFFDSSERVLFYQPLRGQNAFARLNNLFMNFVGFLLLFGSGLILLYGFSGSGHEWLKLLDGWAGGRIKLFLYQLISKTFILLLFCLALAGLSLLLFIIKGVAVNPGQVLIICLTAFIMLLCFLVGGMIAGTLKSRFWGWVSMVIAWFVMAFLIPVLIYHWTYGRADSLKSPYKIEVVKNKKFMDFEKSSYDKEGKFDESKYGDINEIQMFLDFWNGGFKDYMEIEKNMFDEVKPHVSFFQTWAAIFPSTFFLSVNNEMSSRGFANLVAFQDYALQKKKDFIWFIANISIFAKKKEVPPPPFIKGDENIYQGQSQLPGNFNFGLAFTLVWLIVLLWFYWHRFNRMLDHVPKKTKIEFKADRIKKKIINVVLTADRGPYPKLLVELRSQNTAYVAIPKPVHLPGEVKVKDLLGLFGLAVPEKLQKKAGKYIYSLEVDDNGRILLEIIRSLADKAVIIIFDNILSDLSDDLINDFAELLKSLRKNTVIYFTKTLSISTKIADKKDFVHRCHNEKQFL
jgi:hypothetical protein